MISRLHHSIPLVAALCASVVQAYGQMPAAQTAAPDDRFQQMDKNKDGFLTRDELPKAQIISRLDKNGDDKISPEEAATLMQRAKGRTTDTPARTTEQIKSITTGPRIEKGSDFGVGRMIADASFTDLNGKPHRLSELQEHRGVVIAMTSATCPVSQRYLLSLARLEKELQAQDIVLLLVNPFASETAEQIRKQVSAHGFAMPYIHDRERTLTTALQARSTTEVFLLDARRTLIYRGALDDQYGLNYNLDAPREHYLRDAVQAMLAGEGPLIGATQPPGCELEIAALPAPRPEPTYHRDVARILQQHCVTCHREDGVAPFALDDLAAVKDRVKTIRRVVTEGVMPPWRAAPPADGQPNPWANDCSLSTRDKTDFIAWIDSPARPLGDPTEAPLPRVWPKGWLLGEPDAVVAFNEPVSVKAEGRMPYVNVTAATGFTEDHWISAVEVMPGARDVVHHILVFIITAEEAESGRLRGAGGGRAEGQFFAIYVPGTSAEVYPSGMAKRVPAGAHVRFQVHYTPNGRAVQDSTRIGFHFAKAEPQWELRVGAASNRRISIPPGAESHAETAHARLPASGLIVGFLPHSHLRGKAWRYDLTDASGQTRTLLDVPHYDFNWQLYYRLAEPLPITSATRIQATAWYDNSARNKANPDPTRTIRWGGQTEDEMMLGYIEYAVPARTARTVSASR